MTTPGASTETRCHHCGKRPDSDGDHSCPCRYTDAQCPTHLINAETCTCNGSIHWGHGMSQEKP